MTIILFMLYSFSKLILVSKTESVIKYVEILKSYCEKNVFLSQICWRSEIPTSKLFWLFLSLVAQSCWSYWWLVLS